MGPSETLALLGFLAIAYILYKGFRASAKIPPREGPPDYLTGWNSRDSQ